MRAGGWLWGPTVGAGISSSAVIIAAATQQNAASAAADASAKRLGGPLPLSLAAKESRQY